MQEALSFKGNVKPSILKLYTVLIYLSILSDRLFIRPHFFLPKVLGMMQQQLKVTHNHHNYYVFWQLHTTRQASRDPVLPLEQRASVLNQGSSPCSWRGHLWEHQLWLSRTLGTTVSDSVSPSKGEGCHNTRLLFSSPENFSFYAICRMKKSILKIPKSILL